MHSNCFRSEFKGMGLEFQKPYATSHMLWGLQKMVLIRKRVLDKKRPDRFVTESEVTCRFGTEERPPKHPDTFALRIGSRNAICISVVGFLTVLTTICGTGEVAWASTFYVDSTADTVDAIPGDGVCDDGAGGCSLRAAIMEANVLAGADIVDTPAGTYTLTIPGDRENAALTGDLDITDELTITGAGESSTIIDGGGIDRVLEVMAAGNITGITIQNGAGSFETAAGAGIYIHNTSKQLTLNNVTIIGNQRGIYNRSGASVILSDSAVIGNSPGSGIDNFGTFEIRNTVIQGNTSTDWGGGIKHGGTMTIDNSLISSNSALGEHGIADIGGFGGGIHTDGKLTISNTTISGNSAKDYCLGGCQPGKGGGIYGAFREIVLEHVTIADNQASIYSGLFLGGAVSMQLKSTIIANNLGGDNCGVFGEMTNLGYNLDSGNSCAFMNLSDLVDTDPLLGPLQDNGGPTLTHALLPGSPAIDHILPEKCTVTTDQRGVSRPSGVGCDIGAYEVLAIINTGLNDAWYDPETSGQGFFITVFPDLSAVSLAWFTYDTELPPDGAVANLGDPGHRWLTAVGPINGNQAIMEIEMTSGGLFDTPTEIQRTDPPGSDGTITLTFDNCNFGTVKYDIPSINRQGIVPIQRVVNDNVVLCEALSSN